MVRLSCPLSDRSGEVKELCACFRNSVRVAWPFNDGSMSARSIGTLASVARWLARAASSVGLSSYALASASLRVLAWPSSIVCAVTGAAARHAAAVTSRADPLHLMSEAPPLRQREFG